MTVTQPEQMTAACLVGIGAFQLALAAGAPWGRASYGGAHDGVLPPRLRTVSGVAAVAYAAAVAAILTGAGERQTRSRGFTVLSGAMAVGVAMNGASPSPVERAIWTPLTAATAALAWRSRTVRD